MENDQNSQVIAALSRSTNEIEKQLMASWATELLEIRKSPLSQLEKAKRAISVTQKAKVIWPALRTLGSEVKRRGWQERSTAGRFGLTGAAIGLTVFGGHGAGIAALGTAIGVPLWVVIGSGAAFAGLIVDEFTRNQ